jgi:hypothetical protein
MRLSKANRRWALGSGAVLLATGALWLVYHYLMRVHGELGETPHPLEHWWLRLHGAAAMVFLVVVGALIPIHMRRAWHQRRNRAMGIALCAVVLALGTTGYALYYFGGEEARSLISLVHWGLGLAAPAAVIYHIARGRHTSAQIAPAKAVLSADPQPAALPLRARVEGGQGKGPSAPA